MNGAREALNALHDLEASGLRIRWRRLFRNEPPAGMSCDLLVRAIAFELQAREHGGLTQTTRRRLRTWARRAEGARPRTDTAIELKPGVRLVREWGARTYHVRVLEEGFEHEGKRYRSLSEVARVITGTHWSGPRFFGLRRRAGPRFEPEALADE